MVGPGMGIPLGLGAITMGSLFTAIGARGIFTTANEPRLIGWGSATLVVGTATFIYSSIKLKRNLTRRREVCGRSLEDPAWRRK